MKLLVFGLGYSAGFIARERIAAGWTVAATAQQAETAERLTASGIRGYVFSPDGHDAAMVQEISNSDAVLVSIPPGEFGDPVLNVFRRALTEAQNLTWIGYLSTIGVYGDRGGGWVDESTPIAPVEPRSRMRAEAEAAWLRFGAEHDVPVHLFRLAGIYGPGRNQLAQLARGTARRIVKPGQVFNRIHVEDIAGVVAASMAKPRAGAIYNVIDDEPAPPQDVVGYAAELCGVAPPPEIPFAKANLSPMASSFFGESKRVRNVLLRRELQVSLRYPTYREGLAALRLAGEGPRLP